MRNRIDPSDYMDYRRFLRDWLSARPGRSYRGFAQSAGCSPSLVSEIVNGRRDLRPRWRERFAEVLGLSGDEATVFRALVILSDSPERAMRQEAMSALIQIRARRQRAGRFGAQERSTARGRALQALRERWYYPVLAELARCEGFRAEPDWVVRALDGAIEAEAARRALDDLLVLGVLVESDDGSIRPGPWGSADSASRDLVAQRAAPLQRWALERALRALDAPPAPERHFQTAAIPIPARCLPDVRRRLEQLQAEILTICAADEGAPDQVYQVCVQLFPVSKTAPDDTT